MVNQIPDWNNNKIPVEESRGGKISVCNYENNLIMPSRSAWPHEDIKKKLHRSNQSGAFASPRYYALLEIIDEVVR